MKIMSVLRLTVTALLAFGSSVNARAFVISDSADLAIKNVLYQIKSIVREGYSPERIESWIRDGKKVGVKEYRVDRYNKQEIGWSVIDSKNREVMSAIFKIESNKAVNGRYFGPLMNKNAAGEIHVKHIELLKTYYNVIRKDVYSLGDGCSATASFFEGTTGLGRTIIDVRCS